MSYDQALLKGTTSFLMEFCPRSSTTGQLLTGLAAGGVTCTYQREGAAGQTTVTLDGTAVLGTWKTGGWKETGTLGEYQFGVPDAAIASGANAVTFVFKATGMIDKVVRIMLEGVDRRDAVRMGLTALPNAAANAVGGLGILDANSLLDVDIKRWLAVAPLALNNQLVQTDVERWLNGVIPAANVAGVPLVDLKYTLGTISPAAAGSVRADAVTGAVGSVTGAVGSVAGNVGGNVVGSVASVTAAVDILQSAADKVWGSATRTLTSFGTLVASIWAGVVDSSGVTTLLARLTVGRTANLDNLDTTVSSRNAVAPPSTGAIATAVMGDVIDTVGADVVAIKAKTDLIPGAPASTTNIAGGVITTVTNLTNAPTAGDLTAAMKASVGAAVLATPANLLVTDASGRVSTTYGLHKNTALPNFEFVMVDSADHVTPKTGLVVTGTVSIDGAAFAAIANAVSEVGSGVYKVNLAASDLNGTDVTLKFVAAGADATLIGLVMQG